MSDYIFFLIPILLFLIPIIFALSPAGQRAYQKREERKRQKQKEKDKEYRADVETYGRDMIVSLQIGEVPIGTPADVLDKYFLYREFDERNRITTAEGTIYEWHFSPKVMRETQEGKKIYEKDKNGDIKYEIIVHLENDIVVKVVRP